MALAAPGLDAGVGLAAKALIAAWRCGGVAAGSYGGAAHRTGGKAWPALAAHRVCNKQRKTNISAFVVISAAPGANHNAKSRLARRENMHAWRRGAAMATAARGAFLRLRLLLSAARGVLGIERCWLCPSEKRVCALCAARTGIALVL